MARSSMTAKQDRAFSAIREAIAVRQNLSMSEINYHRITDWNESIRGLDKHTSFEAGFSTSGDALFLHGRVIDSNGLEVVRSGDLRELVLERYQNWNPNAELADLIEAIELETIQTEPAYFQTPISELLLEIQGPGPVANRKVFRLAIYISHKFTLLGSYEWQDSGNISVSILCEKEPLLEFTRGLQSDLSRLLGNKAV